MYMNTIGWSFVRDCTFVTIVDSSSVSDFPVENATSTPSGDNTLGLCVVFDVSHDF